MASKSFKAQFKGTDFVVSIPCLKECTAEEACAKLKASFGIKQDISCSVYGFNLDDKCKIFEYARASDPIEFFPKDNPSNVIDFPNGVKFIKSVPPGMWRIFTTLSYNSMIEGTDFDIKETFSHSELINYLWSLPIFSSIEKSKHTLIVYLPGGCRFESGKLSDFVQYFPNCHRFLYVVVSRSISDAHLVKKYDIVTDIRKEFATMLSPLFPSSEKGLCVAASLMGYFSYRGVGTDTILKFFSKYCSFVPFASVLYLISNRFAIQGHHIVTACACLLNVLRTATPPEIKNENLWENSLPILYKITTIGEINETAFTTMEQPYTADDGYFADFQKTDPAAAMLNDDYLTGVAIKVTHDIPTLAESKTDYENNQAGAFKVYYVLDLKSVTSVSLFHGKKGISLFIGQQSLKETDTRGLSSVIFPEEGDICEEAIEDIAVTVPGPKQEPTQVKQFICFLLDRSGSMGSSFNSGGLEGYDRLNRLTACMELFYKFVHRIDSTLIETKYGFYVFGSNHQEIAFDTDLWQEIVKSFLKGIRPSGCTELYGAIDHIVSRLTGVKAKYPNAILRLVCLTDGWSTQSPLPHLPQKIIQAGVKIDSIFITNDIEPGLVALTRMSGGSFMAPFDLNEGLQIFERETFYNPQFREFKPYRGNNYAAEFASYKNENCNRKTADPYPPARKMTEATAAGTLVTPLISASKNDSNFRSPSIGTRQRAIIRQIRIIAANKDPSIRVFIPEDKIDTWRVLIKSDNTSEYKGVWFYLIVTFTEEYPLKAPTIRFVTPPFHPNINDDGFICNNILMTSYNRSLSVIEILQEIIFMLKQPNYASPIDTIRLDLFAGHKDWNDVNSTKYRASKMPEIKKRIDQSIARAKKTAEEWIDMWDVEVNEIGISLNLQRDIIVPANFRDPYDKTIMKNPVCSSTGTYYDQKTLNRLAQGENPKGVDGKPLQKSVFDPRTGKGDINRPVDTVFMAQITAWREANKYEGE